MEMKKEKHIVLSLLKQGRFCCLVFVMVFGMVGCATPRYVKTCHNFKEKMLSVKTIGLFDPIAYESNRGKDSVALRNAIVKAIENNTSYQIKLISSENYSSETDADRFTRIVQDSHEVLKKMELEGLWKDKKSETISRKFIDDIVAFKTLDPDLDAILLVKCKQHYGNIWASGLYVFGAVGGIIAAATAEKDPVIGSHMPADNDTYSSAILVDLDTANILWYNFAFKVGLDVTTEKHATAMAKDILYGVLDRK